MDFILKILNESNFIKFSNDVIKAIIDWVEMSGDEKLQTKSTTIIKNTKFPRLVKSDGSILFRYMSMNRKQFKTLLKKGFSITTNDCASWSHNKDIGNIIMNQDFSEFDPEIQIGILFRGEFNNTIVDIEKFFDAIGEYPEYLNNFDYDENFERSRIEESEVIVGANILTLQNIIKVFDSEVSEYDWIKIKDYLKIEKNKY